MRIIVCIEHPRHVHFWKNVIKILRNRGNEVKILAWDKEMTFGLLDVYGFKFEKMGGHYNGILKKAVGLIKNDINLFRVAKRFNADLIVFGDPYSAHVSKILRMPHIFFFATENANLTYWLSAPFSDAVCTPACFQKKVDSKKHLTYDGYMELSYLHPRYFTPDSSVLDDLQLDAGDSIIVVRFVSWGASHDIGDTGFTDKLGLVKKLSSYGTVLITSEKNLEKPLDEYAVRIPPEKIHHLLSFADLYLGESASMAAESAVLGTPSIFVSSSRRGYTDELEEKYGLVHTFSGENQQELALKKAIEILTDKDSKKKWSKKRDKMLKEKIDVARFLADLIEGYPDLGEGIE